jgi:RHS repeat-associated protein
VTLTAAATVTGGTIAKVDFYQGATLIGTASAAPYSFTWSNVPQGSYTLTAVATNNAGQSTTSAAIAITVKSAVAQMYYIHVDHLGTPRLIADAAGATVWRWEQQEPFGNDVPNGDPNSTGTTFDFPLRFPGQYADRETGLAYNYYRDYDSAIGRYVQSDPIGLAGGINTYLYVDGNPISSVDPLGLQASNPFGQSPTPKGPGPKVTMPPLEGYQYCVVTASCSFAIGGAVTFGLPGFAIGLVGGFAGGTAFCPADPPAQPPPQPPKPPTDQKPKPPRFYF